MTADQPVLWQRLQKRGRETSEKISERMQAADKFGLSQANSGDKFSIIDNNGLLQIAGEKFLNILQSGQKQPLFSKHLNPDSSTPIT